MSDHLFIGTLATRPLQDHAKSGREIGYFELEVYIPRHTFLESGAKKSLASKTIGQHLASAVIDTEAPKEFWSFFPSNEFRKEFGWPEVMEFNL